MKAILAVNNLGFIGLNNILPWRSREDFQHFKALTSGDGPNMPNLLVGWNTYNTLPTLKGRVIILDPRDVLYPNPEVIDWCIGGKKTYEKYVHLFTELHISHIDDNSLGDTMFPNLAGLDSDCQIFNYHFKGVQNI